jgi:hypothetical protein
MWRNLKAQPETRPLIKREKTFMSRLLRKIYFYLSVNLEAAKMVIITFLTSCADERETSL